jgi:hypothetical protein
MYKGMGRASPLQVNQAEEERGQCAPGSWAWQGFAVHGPPCRPRQFPLAADPGLRRWSPAHMRAPCANRLVGCRRRAPAAGSRTRSPGTGFEPVTIQPVLLRLPLSIARDIVRDGHPDRMAGAQVESTRWGSLSHLPAMKNLRTCMSKEGFGQQTPFNQATELVGLQHDEKRYWTSDSIRTGIEINPLILLPPPKVPKAMSSAIHSANAPPTVLASATLEVRAIEAGCFGRQIQQERGKGAHNLKHVKAEVTNPDSALISPRGLERM